MECKGVKMNREKQLKEIEELKARLTKLEEECNKPKKFEFKYEGGNTCLISSTCIELNQDGDVPFLLEHGMYRTNKETANLHFDAKVKMIKLGALADQLGGAKKFEVDKNNFFVYYNHKERKFEYDFLYSMESIGVIYMTEECAKEVCRILNNGEYEL